MKRYASIMIATPESVRCVLMPVTTPHGRMPYAPPNALVCIQGGPKIGATDSLP